MCPQLSDNVLKLSVCAPTFEAGLKQSLMDVNHDNTREWTLYLLELFK